ncbi:SulP family inorganic anion transporter [Kaarinaea lacus]
MDILRSNEFSRNIFPGFVMAFINLPMSIGFAFLAGVPPVMMIISSIVCAIIGHFLNASRYAVGGPNSATAILISVAVTPFAPQMGDLYIGYVASLALMVGLWQIIFAMIFAKYHITDYLNNDVIEGLILGIGIIFVLATLYMVLGLPQLSYTQWLIFDVVSLAISTLEGEGSYFALILGTVTIVTGLFVRRSKFKRYSVVIALFVGFLTLLVLERYYSFSIERVGWIEMSLVTSVPDLRQVSFPILANLIAPAFVIAIIGILQAITVAKAIRGENEVFNPLRDIFSQGVQNIFLAFLHGAPSANSINKSVAKKELKSDSRALLYSAAFTVVLVVLLDFIIAYIPLAILGGVLFLSGLSMINGKKIKRYMLSNKKTAAIFFTTAFLVVVVDIYTAVTFSVLATFVINVVSISKVTTSATIKDDNKLVMSVEGTILSHSFSRIQRHFNKVFDKSIKEVVFDIRNANLHVEDIVDFDWITEHAKKGVKVTFLYSEIMEEKLQRLLKLNPEIVGINRQTVPEFAPELAPVYSVYRNNGRSAKKQVAKNLRYKQALKSRNKPTQPSDNIH